VKQLYLIVSRPNDFYLWSIPQFLLDALDSLTILRWPFEATFKPDMELRFKIAGYFKEVGLENSRKIIQAALPKTMPSWGKVRIGNAGDIIRTSSVSNQEGDRNMSYVRVCHLTVYLKIALYSGVTLTLSTR